MEVPFTFHEIGAMKRTAQPSKGDSDQQDGPKEPTLTGECVKRGLKESGSTAELRSRLKRFKRNHDVLVQLQCPVCLGVPPPAELVTVCRQGHHACFSCLLGMVRRPCWTHRCPLRCGPLEVREPGVALRNVIQPLLQDVQTSKAYELYLSLRGMGVVGGMTLLTLRTVSAVLNDKKLLKLALKSAKMKKKHGHLENTLKERASLIVRSMDCSSSSSSSSDSD